MGCRHECVNVLQVQTWVLKHFSLHVMIDLGVVKNGPSCHVMSFVFRLP